MLTFLKTLWASAYSLPVEKKKKTVRIMVILAAMAIVVVLIGAGITALDEVPAESPMWEAILQSRLALVRLALSVPILLLGWFTATILYQTYEHSYLGRRTVIWTEGDPIDVKAEKTRNSGNIQAALLLACIVGLLLAILR